MKFTITQINFYSVNLKYKDQKFKTDALNEKNNNEQKLNKKKLLFYF